MVHNTTKLLKLPFSNATMKASTSQVNAKGEGMGSVLLRTGGPGAGSSYMDIDDYIRTTGINPKARMSKQTSSGEGLKKLNSKLLKLQVEPQGVKRKNITMSF